MDGFTDHHVQFFTAVCKDWLPLLATDKAKQIIINDLQLRIKKGQAKVCACVIMPNHLHLIWLIRKDFRREEVQRDFLCGYSPEVVTIFLAKQRTGSGSANEVHLVPSLAQG